MIPSADQHILEAQPPRPFLDTTAGLPVAEPLAMRIALLATSLLLLAPAAARADEPQAPPIQAQPTAPPAYAPTPPAPYAPATPPVAYSPPPRAPGPLASPAELPPEDPRPSHAGMRIGGIVATSLGGAQVFAGGVVLLVALSRGGLCGLYGESCASGVQIGVGAGLMISGGVALAVGIPLIVRSRKLDRAMMARSWHGAPGGAGWEWQF